MNGFLQVEVSWLIAQIKLALQHQLIHTQLNLNVLPISQIVQPRVVVDVSLNLLVQQQVKQLAQLPQMEQNVNGTPQPIVAELKDAKIIKVQLMLHVN